MDNEKKRSRGRSLSLLFSHVCFVLRENSRAVSLRFLRAYPYVGECVNITYDWSAVPEGGRDRGYADEASAKLKIEE